MRICFLLLGAVLFSAASWTTVAPPADAQSYTLQPDSKVWVDGTSNKSDFTVHATEIDASAELGADNVPTTLQITMPSASIKSNESTIMDRLLHDALKVEEHATITFELSEAAASSDGSLSTTGKLTLAGVTRDIEMDITAEQTDEGIRYTGTTPLKMSDYNIKPPVAMFGALRTADDVTVGFDVVFVPAS